MGPLPQMKKVKSHKNAIKNNFSDKNLLKNIKHSDSNPTKIHTGSNSPQVKIRQKNSQKSLLSKLSKPKTLARSSS